MKRLFLLALLLTVRLAAAAAGEASAPELLRLEEKLTAQQESKKNGTVSPEQYQAFLEKFRPELTNTLSKIPPSPGNTSAHARILVLLGEHTEAAATLNRALEERPSDNALRMSLGQTQLAQKDYVGARASADEVLKTDPNNKNALFLRHETMGRIPSAESAPEPKAATGFFTAAQGSSPVQSAPQAVSTRRRSTIAGDPRIQGLLNQPINGDSEIQQTPGKNEKPANGFPLLPVAAMIGFGSIGYGVARSKTTWAEQNSEAPTEEDPNSDRIRGNRYHLKVAAISAAIGFGVVYGGIWVLGTVVPAIAKVARDGGGSLQRVATSEAGAINPRTVKAAESALKPEIWSPGKFGNPTKNALEHWNNHKVEFPELRNSKEYVDAAWKFIRNPPQGTLVKDRLANGDRVFYHPNSNTLAIRAADGAPRTMFKPSPLQHRYPTNLEYFNAQ